MPNHVEQPIVRSTQPSLNAVNDAVPGGQQSISGANTYAAQLGMRMWLDGNPGGVRSVAATGTLYGGCFQYVQFYLSSTASNVVGGLVAWAYPAFSSTPGSTAFEKYVVTPDTNAAAAVGRIAGVTLNVVTKGNYGWIQTKGLASVLFGPTVVATDGVIVYADVATAGGAIAAADATATTNGVMKALIGVTVGAPTASTISLVLLRGLADVI